MHGGDASAEKDAKELCHRMVVQGLLHPFSDSTAKLQGHIDAPPLFDVSPHARFTQITTSVTLHQQLDSWICFYDKSTYCSDF